jgi:hypothetical protein
MDVVSIQFLVSHNNNQRLDVESVTFQFQFI